jgi:hypothetical protein
LGSEKMPKKIYADVDFYERKLATVMERLGVDTYKFNWDRFGGWVDFQLKGEWYRFEHSVEKAQAKGKKLQYGSDAFAQVVLSLEDLARMVERGIYELSTWVSGMRFLPPVIEIPDYFKELGFSQIPATVDDVLERYRNLAKVMHPDKGGTVEDFQRLKANADQAISYLQNEGVPY